MGRVLVACEESQTVCKAFRALGHEAYSCDIQECSGGHPEWHFKQDVFEVIEKHGPWDMMIAHPPCTFLTCAANRSFVNNPVRWRQRLDAMIFVYKLLNVHIEKIALENPIGVISSHIRKPEQIIQPYMFGDPERKGTCLWLKNLQPLEPTNIVEPEIIYHKSGRTDGKLHFDTLKLPKEERSKIRSKTFPGIAQAMAEQWGKLI